LPEGSKSDGGTATSDALDEARKKKKQQELLMIMSSRRRRARAGH